MRLSRQNGQAAVEFIALLPLVAIIGALMWQFVLAGHTAWAAHAAARAGARAQAVGQDPEQAARGRLPGGLKRGMTIRTVKGDEVAVVVRIPVVAGLPSLGKVRASAHFQRQV